MSQGRLNNRAILKRIRNYGRLGFSGKTKFGILSVWMPHGVVDPYPQLPAGVRQCHLVFGNYFLVEQGQFVFCETELSLDYVRDQLDNFDDLPSLELEGLGWCFVDQPCVVEPPVGTRSLLRDILVSHVAIEGWAERWVDRHAETLGMRGQPWRRLMITPGRRGVVFHYVMKSTARIKRDVARELGRLARKHPEITFSWIGPEADPQP